MTPDAFRTIRQRLGLTQTQLADRLRTTRMTITRYECGTRRIPGVVEAILSQLDAPTQIPMAGVKKPLGNEIAAYDTSRSRVSTTVFSQP